MGTGSRSEGSGPRGPRILRDFQDNRTVGTGNGNPPAPGLGRSADGARAVDENLAENIFLTSSFSTFGGVTRHLWIGFTDEAVEGSWVWVNGSMNPFTNWWVVGGAPYYYGDGSVISCPCANDAYLVATRVENDFGIFFGAANQVNGGIGNPLNDGLRCAGGSLVRLIPPTMASGNQAITPMPIQALDTGAASGVTRRYQYWFRTPAGPCGQMANLTNGYEIVWGA